MNQQEFLQALELELDKISHLDKSQKVEILDAHRELFRLGMEQSRTEEEIAASLGTPQAIARYYQAHQLITLAELEASFLNLFRAIKAVLKLGIANLVLVLGPVLGVAGAMTALLAAGLVVSCSGLFLLIGVIANLIQPGIVHISDLWYSDSLTAAATISMSIGLAALGMLFLIGDYYLWRILYRGTLRYLRLRLNRKEDTYAQ
ncbi:MAG TPA: DUF1700 domain-containing protein [Syntrophomonadaceae bacterium]|nr:DUF1700 domain-containing protein [Syntrophomonadaceae bacterium]HOQ08535.1 DUF1700 domain-containing protein [Syntrophomonadaceae bacterium]HPU48991.1 DUF1700 domain-containing protein [Syntrophomonadaceae bacterium]